jgi:hypothetical protein
MITLRKIDLTIQGFALLMALFILMFESDYLYFLEPLVGIWQLGSALFNAHSMHHAGNNYRRRIYIYWILAITALIILWASRDVVFFIVTHACWGIAIYYWILYFLFIRHLDYRQELSTVIRK